MTDWRLVDRYDFSGGVDGWVGTSTLIGTTAATIENVSYGTFNGNVIRPSGNSNTPVLKKAVDLSGVGSYTAVKIIFKYYFTDDWDGAGAPDLGFAGFATDLNATNPVICWSSMNQYYANGSPTATSYTGTNTSSDAAIIGQMVANTSATSFYIFAGMKSDEATGNERFAISNVEVWVR